AQVRLRLFVLAVRQTDTARARQPARLVDVRGVPVFRRPGLVALVALVADLDDGVLGDRALEAYVPGVGPRDLDVRVEEERAIAERRVDRERRRRDHTGRRSETILLAQQNRPGFARGHDWEGRRRRAARGQGVLSRVAV